MTTTTQRTKEVMDRAVNTLAASIGHVVGVDSKGHAHAYYPENDVVRIYNTGADYEVGDYLDEYDVIREDPLGGRPLSDWMRFVETRRGWERVTGKAPNRGLWGDVDE